MRSTMGSRYIGLIAQSPMASTPKVVLLSSMYFMMSLIIRGWEVKDPTVSLSAVTHGVTQLYVSAGRLFAWSSPEVMFSH